MASLLGAVLIYELVFGADYLFYVKQKSHYNYVSVRTFLLFIGGQTAIILLFLDEFQPFIENIYTELVFVGILVGVLLSFSYIVSRENTRIRSTISRTERSFTPGYVLAKGTDILFQQMVYAAIAISLVGILGTSTVTYISFMVILVIIHTPIVLKTNKQTFYILTLGLMVFSAPFLYAFSELMLFWPSVYIHSLAYTFMWMAFADSEDQKHSTQNMDISGKVEN